MDRKLVLLLVSLLLLVGGVLFFVAGGRESTGRGEAEAAVPAPAPVLAEEAPPVVESPLAAAPPATREEARLQVDSGAPAAAAPARGELAGLTGRVVESDGAPVAGIRVALLEFDGTLLFDGSAIGAEEPTLELEETRTDPTGRFVLGGARATSFHGLGVDLGGPRATIRLLDHALVHRQRTDVGDVVLAPYGVITGRVLDESGAPVPGARVRFAPFPAEILQASPQEIRSDSLLAVGLALLGGKSHEIIEPPGWIRGAIERFPVPTTQSGADGSFRLAGVALAQLVGGVDKPGYAGVPLGPIDLTGGTHDAGDVVLKRGRTVRGVVEDYSGEPAVGVDVFAGAELFPGVAAILQPCGPTDDEGRFELSGVAESGQIVAAARRARHEPWSTAVSARHEGILVEIESTASLTVNVHDERGEPLSGARLLLVAARRADERPEFLGFLAFLPRPALGDGGFSEVAPGRYVNASLGAGLYDVSARVPGLAPAFQRVECLGSELEVTLTCRSGQRIELSVVDAATRAPVAGARASVLRSGSSGFTKLALETTGPDGRARLGPLPDLSALPPELGFIPSETVLFVQHPRHGDHSAALDPDVAALEVALSAGGTLAGRVHWAGAVPERVYMLSVEYRGAQGFLELFHLPRLAVTDLAGEFRLSHLAPGRYDVELSERFLQQDPLSLIGTDFEPATLHTESVEVLDGQTTELVIDLTPTGRGALASVIGRVRFDGRNLEGAEVHVSANENLSVSTDSSGRFETPLFSVRGSASIQIWADVPLAGGSTRHMQLYSESVELRQDDVHEIQLDLYPLRVRARVVAEASGEPVPGAEVSAEFHGEEGEGLTVEGGETDAAGEVELLVLQAGEYRLQANADGFGRAGSSLQVSAQGSAEAVLIRLPRSVPCAGRVERQGPADGSAGFAYLWVQAVEGSNSSAAMLSPPEHAFELEGLVPGRYRAHIFLGSQQGEEVEFELGPEGDEDLVLYFTPRSEED